MSSGRGSYGGHRAEQAQPYSLGHRGSVARKRRSCHRPSRPGHSHIDPPKAFQNPAGRATISSPFLLSTRTRVGWSVAASSTALFCTPSMRAPPGPMRKRLRHPPATRRSKRIFGQQREREAIRPDAPNEHSAPSPPGHRDSTRGRRPSGQRRGPDGARARLAIGRSDGAL